MNDNFISYTGIYPIYEYVDDLVSSTSNSLASHTNHTSNMLAYHINYTCNLLSEHTNHTSNILMSYINTALISVESTSNNIITYINNTSNNIINYVKPELGNKQNKLLDNTADRVVVSANNGNITVSSVSKTELEGMTDRMDDLQDEIQNVFDSVFEDPLDGLDGLDLFQQGQATTLAGAVGTLATQVQAIAAATAGYAALDSISGLISDAIQGANIESKIPRSAAPQRPTWNQGDTTPGNYATVLYMKSSLFEDTLQIAVKPNELKCETGLVASGYLAIDDVFKNSKQDTILFDVPDRVVVSVQGKNITPSTVSKDELEYLSGTTKNINQHFTDTSNYVNITSNAIMTTVNYTSNEIMSTVHNRIDNIQQNYTQTGHGHVISDIQGLQTALDSKQPTLSAGTGISISEANVISGFDGNYNSLTNKPTLYWNTQNLNGTINTGVIGQKTTLTTDPLTNYNFVGIGTASPAQSLHIHTEMTSMNETNNQVGVLITSDNTISPNFLTYTSGLRMTLDVANSKSYVMSGEDKDLILGANNTNTLYLKPSGKVGIGWINPSCALDVGGDINIVNGMLRFNEHIQVNNGILRQYGSDPVYNGNPNPQIGYFMSMTDFYNTTGNNSSFYVGIGTTYPTANLHLHKNNAGYLGGSIFKMTNTSTSDDGLRFGLADGTNRGEIFNFDGELIVGRYTIGNAPDSWIYFGQDSKVGINTESPQYNLDVNGSINCTGGLNIGGIRFQTNNRRSYVSPETSQETVDICSTSNLVNDYGSAGYVYFADGLQTTVAKVKAISYNELTDKPTLFNGDYNSLTNKLTAGANITINANNEISSTASSSVWTDNTSYINYNNVQVYPNEIRIRNEGALTIDSYLTYKFKNEDLLTDDSSTNNRDFTNYAGSYDFNGGKNSILLQTNDYALLPSENWGTFTDFSIAGWFKTTNSANNDILLEFSLAGTSQKYPPSALSFTNKAATLSNKPYGNGEYTINWSLPDYIGGFPPTLLFDGVNANSAGGHFATNQYASATGNYTGQQQNTNFIVSGYFGCWVRLTLPDAIFLTSIKIYQRPLTPARAPRDYKIYGTNDLTNWTELIHTTNASYSASLHTATSANQNNSFKTFALVVNKIGQDTILNFDELEFYGYTNKSLSIKKISNNLSFQIESTQVYSVPYALDNTWTHILWNIKNATNTPFVRISTTSLGTEQNYTYVAPTSATYTNKLGNITNTGSVNISDFRIFTTPLTSTIKNDVYSPVASYTTLVDDAYVQSLVNNLSTFDGDYNSLTNKPLTFPPSSHNHEIANINGLSQEFINSSNYTLNTSNTISNSITGLSTIYAPINHSHNYALIIHNHMISDINGLQTALDGKASTTHNHDGIYSLVGHNHDGTYAPISHTHSIANITGLSQEFINSSNYTLNTSNEISNRITGLNLSSSWSTSANNYTTASVGIGTTNPVRKLHLHNTSTTAIGVFTQFTDDSPNVGANSSRGCLIGKSLNNNFLLYNYTNGADIVFATAPTTTGTVVSQMTIDTSGNVGIGGAPSASYKLEVTGSINITTGNTYRINGSIVQADWSQATTTNQEFIKNKPTYLSRWSAGTSGIQYNGNVGIINRSTEFGTLTLGYSDINVINDIDASIVLCRKTGATGRNIKLAYNSSFDFVIGDYGNNTTQTWKEQFKIANGAAANSLVINSSGNIGIGEASTTYKLEVNGDIIAKNGWIRMSGSTKGLYNETSQCHFLPCQAQYGNWEIYGAPSNSWNGIRFSQADVSLMCGNTTTKRCGFHYNGTGWALYIDENRNAMLPHSLRVGSITTPVARFEVESGTYNTGNHNFRYMNYTYTDTQDFTYLNDTCAIFNSSIWVKSWIATSSDIRIKKDIQDIVDDDALQKILSIQPKKYKYIDDVARNTSNYVYGFIAQQIKEVLPDAIDIKSQIIPNIFKKCEYTSNGIYYENTSNIQFSSNLDIDIISLDGTRNVYKVQEYSSNYIKLDKEIQNSSNVFLYGTEVNDFHTLNKDYIFTLNVCATQELHRIIQKQEERIQRLENIISSLYMS